MCFKCNIAIRQSGVSVAFYLSCLSNFSLSTGYSISSVSLTICDVHQGSASWFLYKEPGSTEPSNISLHPLDTVLLISTDVFVIMVVDGENAFWVTGIYFFPGQYPTLITSMCYISTFSSVTCVTLDVHPSLLQPYSVIKGDNLQTAPQ